MVVIAKQRFDNMFPINIHVPLSHYNIPWFDMIMALRCFKSVSHPIYGMMTTLITI